MLVLLCSASALAASILEQRLAKQNALTAEEGKTPADPAAKASDVDSNAGDLGSMEQ